MKTTYYTHIKKGKIYYILNLCQYQHEDVWYDAIMYQDVESRKSYVREIVDFDLKFKVIEE